MKTFAHYSDAKTAAERVVRELANGSQSAALTATQSRDALVAFENLKIFCQASGRRLSLLAAIFEFVEASGKLGGRTLGEAVEGYLRTVATVKCKDIGEAVTIWPANSPVENLFGVSARAEMHPDLQNF